jgi:hypothetical protein
LALTSSGQHTATKRSFLSASTSRLSVPLFRTSQPKEEAPRLGAAHFCTRGITCAFVWSGPPASVVSPRATPARLFAWARWRRPLLPWVPAGSGSTVADCVGRGTPIHCRLHSTRANISIGLKTRRRKACAPSSYMMWCSVSLASQSSTRPAYHVSSLSQ